MTAFSLGTVWEETIAFLRRESGLLIPVALAIYGPAQLMLNFGMQAFMAMRTPGAAISWQGLLVLPGGALTLFGNLVIALLVIAPGISVGEALRTGLRRLPVALGAMLMLGLAASLVTVFVSLGAFTVSGGAKAAGVVSLLLVLVMIPIGILWLRLLLLPAVIAVEPVSAKDGIKRAWDLSRNNVLRLIGMWVLVLFLSILLAMIEVFVIGSLVQLLKLGTGDAALAATLQAVANGALEAMLSMGFAVYLALAYRTLTGR
ncbi:MAG: hypothetical protein V4618_15885 [Pseudomonadota bacterium]